MYGITINNDIILIDVNTLFTLYKSNENILTYLYNSALNKKIMIIRVGKQITFSSIEKNYNFIKEIAKIFCNIPKDTIEKCYICDTPYSFKSIFSLIKPILKKDTLQKIHFDKNNMEISNISNMSYNI